MTMKTVKPAKSGLVVKNPNTLRAIPAEGINVDVSLSYWQRLLACGDIVICDITKSTNVSASNSTTATTKNKEA
jgi:hypothetical protein